MWVKNFGQYNLLCESYEKKVLYHGSDIEFDEFDDGKISSGDGGDLFGNGYYLTDAEVIADFYANQVTKRHRVKKYDLTGIFKSPIPVYHDDAEDYAHKNKKVNMFKVEGNILDVDTYVLDEDFMRMFIDSYVRNSGWGEKESLKLVTNTIDFMRNNKSRIRNYRGELHYVITQLVLSDAGMLDDIKKYIMKMGFDGIKYRPDKDYEGNNDSWNYVIYNKNVITKVK